MYLPIKGMDMKLITATPIKYHLGNMLKYSQIYFSRVDSG